MILRMRDMPWSSADEGFGRAAQQAINAGLEQVQSSMTIKGDVIAMGNAGGTAVDNAVFTMALVSAGDPVDLTSTAADRKVVMSYRDGVQLVNNLDFTVAWVGANDADNLLEANELAEITVDLTGLTTALGPDTGFTVEIKPPTGSVLKIERTTPAAIEAVMDLN